MLLIIKDNEPDGLRQDREDGNSFNGRYCKKELNEALLKNQGHLCVYCMKRVGLGAIRVEHYKPRKYRHLELVYSNLFIACTGYEGTKKHTCDVKKGEDELIIDPTNPEHIESILYGSGGNISSSCAEFERDINETLCLNDDRLVYLRQEIYYQIAKKLKQAKDEGRITVEYLEKLLNAYHMKVDDKLEPFCGVAIWYIKRKLQSLKRE